MTFRQATPTRTPCEILREINDLCQSNSERDKVIRQKLDEVMKAAKLMSNEIHSNNDNWNNLTWKDNNPDYKFDWKVRTKETYRVK